jgi:phenylpyruvate tautomerase PptA (4-oxalocrotonate tautomerase family)
MGPVARFVKEDCHADHSHLAARRKAGSLPAGNLRWPLPGDARDAAGARGRPVHDHHRTRRGEFSHRHAYGVARSDDVVYIKITVFDTRTAEQKKALFKRTAELLGKNPGIRPEDVFITILASAKENWSVGNGVAQFA